MFENQTGAAPVPPSNLPTEPDDMFSAVEPSVASPGTPLAPPNALAAGMLKPKAPIITTMPELPASEPPLPPPALAMGGGNTHAPGVGKMLLAIAIIVVAVGLVIVGFWLYRKSIQKALPPAVTTAAPSQADGSVVIENQPPAVIEPPPAPAEVIPATVPLPPALAEISPTTPSSTALPSSSTTDALSKTTNDQILFGEQIDSDKDGVSDSDEMTLYRADPHNADTDGDGLTDGEEILVWHTNALKPDSDGDGLTDGDEVKLWHTNPLNPDTDGDGYVDGKEVANGFNPIGPGKLLKFPAGMSTSTYNTKYSHK